MKFISVRIITADVERLIGFYEQVTESQVNRFTEDFAELKTPVATLAIASTRTLKLFGEDIAQAAANRTAILEFRVENVDDDYARLADSLEIVQKPTTMPWGNRSMLLRDPDGNLVNLFTPVSPEALEKFAR